MNFYIKLFDNEINIGYVVAINVHVMDMFGHVSAILRN